MAPSLLFQLFHIVPGPWNFIKPNKIKHLHGYIYIKLLSYLLLLYEGENLYVFFVLQCILLYVYFCMFLLSHWFLLEQWNFMGPHRPGTRASIGSQESYVTPELYGTIHPFLEQTR